MTIEDCLDAEDMALWRETERRLCELRTRTIQSAEQSGSGWAPQGEHRGARRRIE